MKQIRSVSQIDIQCIMHGFLVDGHICIGTGNIKILNVRGTVRVCVKSVCKILNHAH